MKKIKMVLIVILMCFGAIGLASCNSADTDTSTEDLSSQVTTSESGIDSNLPPLDSGNLPPLDSGNLPPMGGISEETTESLTAEEVFAYTAQSIFTSDKDASKKDLINTYETEDATVLDLSQGDTEITTEGTYILTGTYTDLEVTVNVLDSEKVTLVLDNFNVTNEDKAVIYVLSADKVYVNALEGTTNSLVVTDTFAETEEGVDAVVYSKSDLTVKGLGTLNITSSNDGVVSKDDLVLSSLTLNVTAENNGVVGKDSLVVASGTYTVDAEKDGMKSNGDDEDGVFIVNDGTFTITAGDDGFAATNLIKLEAGTFNITSADDGIDSDGDIVLDNPTLEITAGDDGVTAYYDLEINGGTITILDSYEGLEAKSIKVNDGTISIVSTDDGINASDSDDSTVEESNDPDGNYHSTGEDIIFSMFGGTIYIDASSDGIDSNGNIYIDGGTIEVNGASTDAENPMDYNLNAVIVSGSVVSVGYSGMAQNFTVSSTNVSILYNFTVENAGTEFSITDESGNTVYTYTLKKSASSILISSDELSVGSTYTLTVGDSTETVTISSNVTSAGVVATQMGQGRR